MGVDAARPLRAGPAGVEFGAGDEAIGPAAGAAQADAGGLDGLGQGELDDLNRSRAVERARGAADARRAHPRAIDPKLYRHWNRERETWAPTEPAPWKGRMRQGQPWANLVWKQM